MVQGYFDPPQEFVMYPPPHIVQLTANALRLYSNQLHSDVVHYVVANRKCDEVYLNMMCGDLYVQDSVEIFCGCDALTNTGPLLAAQNWWTSTHGWIYRSVTPYTPLVIVFLSEAFMGFQDFERKFNTYVDALLPDVVVVTETWRRTGLHGRLIELYSDFVMLELTEGSQTTVWLYYNSAKVEVIVQLDKSFSHSIIKRVVPPASPPMFDWNYATEEP